MALQQKFPNKTTTKKSPIEFYRKNSSENCRRIFRVCLTILWGSGSNKVNLLLSVYVVHESNFCLLNIFKQSFVSYKKVQDRDPTDEQKSAGKPS